MRRDRAVTCLALAALASGCAIMRRHEGTQALRVATYNIQAGGAGLDQVVAAIREMRPDVIGLQEVDVHWSDRSKFADQASDLAAALGMHLSFAPIYRIPGANASLPIREFGVALLSRYPIVETRNDSLTRLSTQDQNARPQRMPGLLDAIVEVGGRRVRFMVTHLDYRADPAVRNRQVREMLEVIGKPAQSTILLGDLNAPPDAAELQSLFEVLRDSWRAERGFTYPSGQPAKRIDYVLASPDLQVLSARVASPLASDHRAVVVEIAAPSGHGNQQGGSARIASKAPQ